MNVREAPPWRIAARQHGIITASQLGMSRSAIANWVRMGRIHRVHRGVYAYGHPTLYTCRNLDHRDVTIVNGIPVTTVARTLVDLADDMDAEDIAHVIHEAAYLNKFSLEATRAALERANGRRGVKVLEAAIELHLSGSAGSRSRLEQRFRRLVAGAGLPDPRHNVNVNGFEVDFAWPRVIVEIDGPGHRRARTKADDRIQDAALRAAGYTVVRFKEADVDHRPEFVLQTLRQAGVRP